MDRHHQRTIVPVTAISTVQMASGPPVQRPVPEEYVLADLIMRTIETREGREVEFVLKAYLDFQVLPSGADGKCCFMESLGLTSVSVPVVQELDLDGLIERVRVSETRAQLLAAIEDIGALSREITGTEEILLRGVISNPIASGLVRMLTWPSREQAESYSVMFPSTIDPTQSSSAQDTVRKLAEVTRRAEKGLPWLVDSLSERVQRILASLEYESSQTLSRLDLRITALRKDISSLELKIKQLPKSERHGTKEVETRDILRARQSALEKDVQRREQALSDSQQVESELRQKMGEVQSELQGAREMVSAWRRSVDTFETSPDSVDMPENGVRLLVPIFIAGLSRKGRLDITVYPPSELVSDTGKVSRRRNFGDSLLPASDGLAQLAALCEEQISKDVTLKKAIRDFSETRNLLALKSTRTAIEEGAKLLLSEGIIKTAAIDEIKSLLSGLPEQPFTLDATAPAGVELIPGKVSDCTVILHVHGENDAPIGGAVFETGDLRIEGNEQGIIRVRLWSGSHRACISAPNYRDKSIELSVQSGTDTAIPVVLSRVSREEEIERELDHLIERAEHIDQIRKRLWNAFETQGETLLSIPAYRSSLTELLTDVGYDPELWIAEARTKKGMIKRFLKRDDRVDALRRDILRIAEQSTQSGGIMLFSALLVRLDAMGWTTDSNEVTSIIDGLSHDGLIEGVTVIEGGARLIKFVPVGLTDDPQKILGLAAMKDGRLTPEDVVVGLGWREERVRNALGLLVSNGVAKVQKSYSQSTQYWFPGLRTRPAREQDSERQGKA